MSLPTFSYLNVITRGDTNIVVPDDPTVGDGSLYVNSRAIIYGTNTSNSPTSGALLVAGGAGIGGSANIGTDLSVTGNSTLTGTLTSTGDATFAGILSITNTTDAATAGEGALVVDGGASIAIDLRVGGDQFLTGSLTVDGSLIFTNTDDATSTTTGALQVAGGAGIVKSLWVGGIVRFINTTVSTSSTTGAVVISGGVGIAGDTYTGGQMHVTDLLQVNSVGNAGLVLNFNTDTTGTDNAYFNITRNGVLQGSLRVDDATSGLPLELNSDVTNNVTLVRGGGLVGIGTAAVTGQKLTVAGVTKITDTTVSTTATNGALIVAGGTGISGATNIENRLSVRHSNPQIQIANTTSGNEASILFASSNDYSTTAGASWFVGHNVGGVGAGNFAFFAAMVGGIGTTVSMQPMGVVRLHATDDATSTTTGILRVGGGAGIAKALWVGGIVTITDSTTSTATTNGALVVAGGAGIAENLNVGGIAKFLNTADAASTTTGSVVVSGGVGIAADIHLGGDITLQNTTITSTADDLNLNANTSTIRLRNTAGSVSGEFESTTTDFNFMTTTVTPYAMVDMIKATGVVMINTTTDNNGTPGNGALVVAGGASIAENTYVGGDLTVGGNITSGGGTVSFSSTVDSTSTTTGALVTPGGVGIGKTVYIGENLVVAAVPMFDPPTVNLFTVSSQTFTDNDTSGATVASWSAATIGTPTYAASNAGVTVTSASTFTVSAAPIAGTNVTITDAYAMVIGSGRFISYDTTASTSPTTGSIITSGGVGIGGNTNIAGIATVTNTTNSTGIATGALVVGGGASVTNDLFVGGLVRFLDTTVSTTPTTGALTVAGGTGINGALNVAGATHLYGTLLVDGAITITDTTQSTLPSNGSLVLAGGLGVAKNTNIGGTLSAVDTFTLTGTGNVGIISNYNTDTTGNDVFYFDVQRNGVLQANIAVNDATVGRPLELNSVVTNGVSIANGGGNVGIGQHPGTRKLTVNGDAIVLSTDNSTSITTGALVVDGGVGIAKDTFIGGLLRVLDTTEATSRTTGAVTIAGGLGVAKSIWGQQGFYDNGGAVFNIVPINTGVGLNFNHFTSGATAARYNFGSSIPTGGYETQLMVYGFGIGGASVQESLRIANNATGAFIDFVASGVGAVQRTLTVYTNTVFNVDGTINQTNTTDATSTTAASVMFAGGVGIAKALYVGTDIHAGDTVTTSPFTFTSSHATATDLFRLRETVDTSAASFAFFNDADTYRGSFGLANTAHATTWAQNNLYMDLVSGQSFVLGSGSAQALSITETGLTTFLNTTNSTAYTTGSVVLAGGLGVAKDISGNGEFRLSANVLGVQVNDAIGPIITRGTEPFTSGAYNTAGRYGIFHETDRLVAGVPNVAGRYFVIGSYNANSTYIELVSVDATSGQTVISSTVGSNSSGSGALIVMGGVGIAEDLNVGGDVSITGNLSVTNGITFDSTAQSTSVSTGALVLLGGLGVAKNAYIGGLVRLVDTTGSTSTTTGTLVVSGGAGIAENLWVGGNINIPTGNTFTGGQLTLTGTGANTIAGTVSITDTTTATSATSAALTVAGGAGIGGGLYVTGAGVFSGSISAGSTATFAGITTITDTTDSTACGNGALVVAGGAGISLNLNVCGNQTVGGTFDVTGNSTMDGTLTINDTTQSTTIGTGALVVAGGVGIAKNATIGGNINVSGNAVIVGNLTVSGTIASVDVDTVTIQDNVLLVNSGPSGSADAGFGMKRFQAANDVGAGDVVNDTPYYSGTARTGSTATTIVLDTGASAVANHYAGDWIMITGGTGANQVRRIASYDPVTKVATIMSTADQAAADPAPVPVEGMDWTVVPDATSTFEIFDTQYVLQYYDESEDMLILGATGVNPASAPFVTVRSTIPMRLGSIYIDGTAYVDTIQERTVNAGVTIEGVLIKDNNLTNVNSINGTLPDVTTVLGLVDNNVARTTIPNTGTSGSFIVLVRAANTAGAMASFVMHNSGGTTPGLVNRTGSSRGANNEDIDIEWPAGASPRLKHRIPITGASGATLSYNVKVIRV